MSLLSTLQSLVTPANLSSVLDAVGSAFSGSSTTLSTVQPLINQLQVVFGNEAAVSAIVTEIEATPGVPSVALSLLEKLRTVTDPLLFQQYLTAIEQDISTSSSSLATSLKRAAKTTTASTTAAS